MYRQSKKASGDKLDGDATSPGEHGLGGPIRANWEYPAWEKTQLCCGLKKSLGAPPEGRAPGLDTNYGNVGNDHEMVSDRTSRTNNT